MDGSGTSGSTCSGGSGSGGRTPASLDCETNSSENNGKLIIMEETHDDQHGHNIKENIHQIPRPTSEDSGKNLIKNQTSSLPPGQNQNEIHHSHKTEARGSMKVTKKNTTGHEGATDTDVSPPLRVTSPLGLSFKADLEVVDNNDENNVEINVDLVEKKLYLGNAAAACDIMVLKKYNIHFILTIDSCPLPTKITDLPFVETKYLKVSDMPKEDILRYFEETNKFIDKAVSNEHNGNILVHCYYGVSRSATIVLAYLMQKYRLSLEEAQDRLKSRRSVVGPNYGFLSQLKLYEKMSYRIDRTNVFYKRFRLHVASDKLKSVKVLPTPYTDVIKGDPALHTVNPEPVVYRCRKCRRTLASASNLLQHTENKSPIWFDFKTAGDQANEHLHETNGEGSEESPTDTTNHMDNTIPPPICKQMLFIEPLAWMPDVAISLQGKLYCPNSNCKSKLGSYCWVLGCLCPCGAKVQPAFYLVPSKVDRSTSVLNVQITI